MRIAYDYQIFSWQKYGGISRYVFELANNLALRTSHEVGVICPLHVNEYLRNSTPRLQVKGLNVPKVKKSGRAIAEVNRLLSARIMGNFKPDVVHETYYARVRVAPRDAKVVLTVYDMIHELFPAFFPVSDRTSINKADAVARADHVICISENTRRDLINILGVDPDKTSVAYLGFSLAQPPAEQFAVTRRPYLLYVGHRGGYKNFETLLQAYAASQDLMSNYDLVVFGGGLWRDTELAHAQALGIDAKRLQNIQGDDSVLASLYRNASVFIYPSLYEGFGIPPLEAMGFGCPVVCSDASSLPEVVGGAAELFDPQSPTALLTGIEHILNDSEHRNKLIDRGYVRSKKFSWTHCAEQTVSIYEGLI